LLAAENSRVLELYLEMRSCSN